MMYPFDIFTNMTKLAVLASLFVVSCGSNVTVPTKIVPKTEARQMDYAVNMPVVADVVAFKNLFPQGVKMSPVAAQRHWNYTAAYGGTPNVYYGEVGPKCQNFFNTSIVIAPYQAASKDTFTASDWPLANLEPGVEYEWVGQATLSLPASPETYILDLRCL